MWCFFGFLFLFKLLVIRLKVNEYFFIFLIVVLENRFGVVDVVFGVVGGLEINVLELVLLVDVVDIVSLLVVVVLVVDFICLECFSMSDILCW